MASKRRKRGESTEPPELKEDAHEEVTEPGLQPVPVSEPEPMMPPPPVEEPKAPAPKPNSTPNPGSRVVTGQAARDPNRVVPSGQLRVAAAVWLKMANIAKTSRAGFEAWCRDQGHITVRTPSAWAELYETYRSHPVGRK